MIKQETQNSAENLIRPDQNFEYETLLLNFQKLNIDSVETSDTCDVEWISHKQQCVQDGSPSYVNIQQTKKYTQETGKY